MSKQTAYFACKVLVFIFLLQAVYAADEAVSALDWIFFARDGIEPFIYGSSIEKLLPAALYLSAAWLLWRKAGSIASRFANEADGESANLEGLLRIGIGLLAVYSTIVDISVLLWELNDWMAGGGESGSDSVIDAYVYGTIGSFGSLRSALTAAASLAFSLLILFKAGWIARKLCAMWERDQAKR